MTNERDIAIVGMACVFPGAANLNQYWSNLANGVDAITEVPTDRWRCANNFDLPPGHAARLPMKRGGFLPSRIPFDPLRFGIIPKTVSSGDPDEFLMLEMIDAALRDARIAPDAPVRERTDVIIGRGGYAGSKHAELTLRCESFHIFLELIERQFPELLAGGRRAELEQYLQSTLSPRGTDGITTAIPNIVTSRAANRLNLCGASFIIDAACASSLVAVEEASRRLRDGHCDLAVVGGLFMNQTPTFWHVFDLLGGLSPSGMLRPFDRRADGLLVGEGGGAVILKRCDDALRDGDRVYANLKGVGSASDGAGVDVMAPSSRGQLRALARAYDNANLDPATIEYLEAHGTATIVGDLVEIETIKSFFGKSALPPTQRGMGSVKSMIGHTMPASGIASLIKVALSLSNKLLPPSLHCEQPRPELLDGPFYIVTQTRPWIHDTQSSLRRAGINAFGFGGINVHAVLEEVPVAVPRRKKRSLAPRPLEAVVKRASELAAFSGDSIDEVADKLGRLESFLDQDQSGHTLADVATSLSQEIDFTKPCKLAFVCEDLDNLRALLDESRKLLAQKPLALGHQGPIYFSADAARQVGKIACVFPGMAFPGLAGNYPDHLMELCLHYPELREEFDFFEGRDRHPDDTVLTSAIFSPPASLPEEYRNKLKSRLSLPNTDRTLPQSTGAGERYLAGMGVTLANWISWVLIRQFGFRPDMMSGQSQGEMTALSASGMTDFHQAAPFMWKALNVDPGFKEGECMAFASTSSESLAPLLESEPGASIALDLAPTAVIFGGHKGAVERITERLREQKILAHVLPFPPIHTPHMSHLRGELVDALKGENVPLKKAEIDLYSSITAEKYPDDLDGVRDTLLLNLDHPVRMWQTINKMYREGARIFIQAGGGHFASHVKTLLDEKRDVCSVALDIDTRNPLTQLNHFCAVLFTAGVSLEFTTLYKHRSLRRLNFDQPQLAVPATNIAVPLRIDWSPLTHGNVPPRAPEGDGGADAGQTAISESQADADYPTGASPFESQADGLPSHSTASGRLGFTAAARDHRHDHEIGLHDAQTTAGADAAEQPTMPFLGPILHFVAEQELVMERKLDLCEDLHLHDHLFVHAPGLKPPEECLPTLPMTVTMELMAEAAALLSPGLGLVGFENVKATRWIVLRDESTLDLRIEARVQPPAAASSLSVHGEGQGGGRRIDVVVRVQDRASASATVLFGETYHQDLDFELCDTSTGGDWPVSAADVYAKRRMFHGPSFHTIAGLGAFGNPGFSGELTVLAKDKVFRSTEQPCLLTDPFVLDGVGQFVGLWCQLQDWFIFPTGIEKVEFYCPTPPANTVVPIRCEVTEFDLEQRTFRANIEVEDGAGGLWMRLAGWSDWLFKWPRRFCEWLRNPGTCYLSDEIELPGLPAGSVCTYMTKGHVKNGEVDRIARILLHREEMAQFWETGAGQQQAQLVWSRMALKDAARLWMARDQEDEPVHPAALIVTHDEAGRPALWCQDGRPTPRISMAHSGTAAIALASTVDVGIDLEPADRDPQPILDHAATPDEIALVESMSELQPDEAWVVRLWCAKEAVAKLLGTGLQGRPKDFIAVDLNDAGQLLVEHQPTACRYVVESIRISDMVAAYTSADALVALPLTLT